MLFNEHFNLPPMKYHTGQEVIFHYYTISLHGQIEIADFGGSLENDYHSYDIYVSDINTLFKHIPEANIVSANFNI
ncbi:hypothetical protein N0K71_06675 [Dellaglioa algida]|uniref:Uncharacterized protein n=1 Tax=Dellaglioa algida DSM 15638 TaxID=1423719 RepID=A0A0R1HH96_9LACO|nr:hypothetical protein [Dellaglioa algida]KRK45352.1 hypothetical protein FC66_GL001468 [Dellaglioa algida DSM 15638]MDK1733308.1 hypothetical protein [Dellaglioa algida]MDK1734775.1 hypothetical protein [Dellaglioa algida]